jgi:hypothetical protein
MSTRTGPHDQHLQYVTTPFCLGPPMSPHHPICAVSVLPSDDCPFGPGPKPNYTLHRQHPAPNVVKSLLVCWQAFPVRP